MRARELASRESNSRVDVVGQSTTEGANTDVGTTDGVPNEGMSFGKPYLPCS